MKGFGERYARLLPYERFGRKVHQSVTLKVGEKGTSECYLMKSWGGKVHQCVTL